MNSPAVAGDGHAQGCRGNGGRPPATVSRALHKSEVVQEQTLARVLAAARALGYVPNRAAASLRTQRTGTAGVLAPDLADPLLTPLVRGAEDVLREAGYVMLAASTGGTRPRELDALSGMLSRGADGLIIAAMTRPSLAAADHRVPFVAAGYASSELPSVAADLAEGARLTVVHLASLGHRTVACISCASGTPPVYLLLAAARQAGLLSRQPWSLPRRPLRRWKGGVAAMHWRRPGSRSARSSPAATCSPPAAAQSSPPLAAHARPACQSPASATCPCPPASRRR